MGSSFAGKINNTWVNFLPESLPVLQFQMFGLTPNNTATHCLR